MLALIAFTLAQADYSPGDWLWLLGVPILAALCGWILAIALRPIARTIASRTTSPLDDAVVERSVGPAAIFLPLLAAYVALEFLRRSWEFPPAIAAVLQHALILALIAAVAWLTIRLMLAVEQYIASRYRVDISDNLEARRINTQVRVLRRAATMVVIIIAFALMLMTFPLIRELGLSLLASAGLAGIVLGFAARPVLSNLIAGVQIALTQPMRLDDVVIVQGKWGRIEEILSTYVVVRIWDQRRLIVPLNWFIENTFENWTRSNAEIIGSVFLFVDYDVSVDDLRQELHQLLQESGKWDGKAWALQVTDTTESTVKLRAIMSAVDAPTAWELRCFVRERMLAYLQQHHPQSLPRTRAELVPHPASSPDSTDSGDSADLAGSGSEGDAI